MHTIRTFKGCLAAFALFLSMLHPGTVSGRVVSVASPDGQIQVSAGEENGKPVWWADRKGKRIVLPSPLGFEFGGPRKNCANDAYKLVSEKRRKIDETWSTRFYVREKVRNHANELELEFTDAQGERLGLIVRVYDSGFAFRYIVHDKTGGFQIRKELTRWRFAAGADGWFTTYRSFNNSNEEPFLNRKLASIGPKEIVGMPAIVHTEGQCVALCEADLTNWAGLYYRRSAVSNGAASCDAFEAALAPLPHSNAAESGVAVIRRAPAASPWRVAVCADSHLELVAVASDLVMNLNPPPAEDMDFSWVEPGVSSWDWWVDSNNSLSTASTLKLVDFAAEARWRYHTIDGGWYGWARRPNHGPDVCVEPRPTFDLKRIISHAAGKNVGIFVWLHWEALDDNGVEETLAKLASWGVKGVKIDFMDRNDQKIVLWCERVVRAAAKNKILVNFHGMYKPTGMNRTWPNQITREGIMGNEMTKFNSKITPVHTATLPFTRFLLGPADFTPGSFANRYLKDFVPQIRRGHRYGDEADNRPIWAEEIGTRAHAIALCFIYDSPLATFCDWPERYRGAPGVEALENAPTVWKSTLPLAGEPGKYYAVARETFDDRVYLAAITVEARRIEIPLSFLKDGEWEVRYFLDDPVRTPSDAKAISVRSGVVNAGRNLPLDLCAEGGALAIFTRKH